MERIEAINPLELTSPRASARVSLAQLERSAETA